MMGKNKTKDEFKQNVHQVQLLDICPSSRCNKRNTTTHLGDAQMTLGREVLDASGLFLNPVVFWP